MAEANVNKPGRRRAISVRHLGRLEQVGIYLGKLLRMFVYQSDWKVLPMSALIAGLVGMVIRRKCFITMEGTLMGSFAMVCVCLWNGCFNSIQVICRERDVIKREHRSGMHISSYICAHMIYQFLLCVLQVGVTLYVTQNVGVQYDKATPLMTNWFIVDFGISMLLITYASDMLSLWVSTLARTTTTAMTIMPFVLIFQLVFSGGMLSLPEWTKPLTNFTISNPGLKVIATQSDVNSKPYATIPDMVSRMRDNEVGGTVTLRQVLKLLKDTDNPTIAEIRNTKIGKVFTVGELQDFVKDSAAYAKLRKQAVTTDLTVGDVLRRFYEDKAFQELRDQDFGLPGFTVGELLKDILDSADAASILDKKLLSASTVGDLLDAIDASGAIEKYRDVKINAVTTVGEVVDWLSSQKNVKAWRNKGIELKTTLGELIDLAGEDNVKDFLGQKAAAASYKPDYEYTKDNVLKYWGHLLVFILAFAALSVITLEFIDKDKR